MLDYPYIWTNQPDESACYSLPRRAVLMFLAIYDRLTWRSSWPGVTDEEFDDIQATVARAISELSGESEECAAAMEDIRYGYWNGTIHVPAHQVVENAWYPFQWSPSQFNDLEGWYDNVNHNFTLPSGGLYVISWVQECFYLNNGGQGYHFKQRFNGLPLAITKQQTVTDNHIDYAIMTDTGKHGGQTFQTWAQWERVQGTVPTGNAIVREGSTKNRLSIVRYPIPQEDTYP